MSRPRFSFRSALGPLVASSLLIWLSGQAFCQASPPPHFHEQVAAAQSGQHKWFGSGKAPASGAAKSNAPAPRGPAVEPQTSRVIHGEKTGRIYHGYSGGRFELPHDRGGLLSFDLWNDMPANGTVVLNYLNLEIGPQKIRIPNYATRNQMVEFYSEFSGSWGAAGINRVTVAVPRGVTSIGFDNQGSATGIEISEARFAEGHHALPNGFKVERVRAPGEPVIGFGRVLQVAGTGRKFYGYSSGVIYLPHQGGGVLRFLLWNDQTPNPGYTVNKLNIGLGDKKLQVEQYATAMDLRNFYDEFPGAWGPAGGSEVRLTIPAGVSEVHLNNTGSSTGIEVSDLVFDSHGSGPPAVGFTAKINRSENPQLVFGRVLSGTATGRKFHGYSSGRVVLPNRLGGTLHFTLWNDQQPGFNAPLNQLNIHAGERSYQVDQYSTSLDLKEFYKEFPDQWGPGGGTGVSVPVPAGVAEVRMDNQGSATGIEISDVTFVTGQASSNIVVRDFVNRATEVLDSFGRVIHGEKSGRVFHGYTSGQVILPNRLGGTLTFTLWNDQQPGFNSALNQLNIHIGDRSHQVDQYTTALDLKEFYREFPEAWGPAGGTGVSIPIPAGISSITLDNQGSATGIEITDAAFITGETSSAAIGITSHVNRTTEVLDSFGRVFHGAKSGRVFHGYTSGQVILPNRLGGVLTFNLWNDHNKNSKKTTNRLNVMVGDREKTQDLTTSRSDLKEFYQETPGEWGPAGGIEVRVQIPAGISKISLNNQGSQTGVELTDLKFVSN